MCPPANHQMPHSTLTIKQIVRTAQLSTKRLYWNRNRSQCRKQRTRAVVLWLKTIPTQIMAHGRQILRNPKRIPKNCSSKFAAHETQTFCHRFGILEFHSYEFYCSPLASKPIKQRVEAFEKLQTPQKETRTRTRVMTADSEVNFVFFWIWSINSHQNERNSSFTFLL